MVNSLAPIHVPHTWYSLVKKTCYSQAQQGMILTNDNNVDSCKINMLISEQVAIYLQRSLSGQGRRQLFENNNRHESRRLKRMRINFKPSHINIK